MTCLSRIRINPLRAESRRLLANPRAMHAAVMAGVPDPERILWRLDADNPHRPHIFVLTRSKPDWTHLVEMAGWPGADGEHAAVRDYAPLLDRVAAGREFAFRLTANPVQNTMAPAHPTPAQAVRIAARVDKERTRGFRLGHRTASAQLEWFLNRTGRWGFEVPASPTDPPSREVRIVDRRRNSFAKNGRGPQVTFNSVTFEGRLRVTDAEPFRRHLVDGIGPSKAYGCGLLTLAPLPRTKS
ncbi:type I-E CRISPR-associated protein Cas6/Cse3/CasE [Streptomyces sp. AV19]|uniref:type I-E CRISPR-associated protein Cas6/Cse3/CasE n=1 Tax=Streptomyces sp. AV19 TaxID=2793068 RepID=UPI0018FE9C98|nr:type I-E CRISPR-associated protein Cas6/Cse3/CasE [Streptomyces sp. AV19]MBH1938274.1 type I-E CRISPR-associated protein Cas6/Cse3/CasE [Streptomyces sp. AV19]MDG4534904.1 type I-E CRISPR-associated protein Cas6/Cse3/CasE [Streptomyces sp. AV19]